MAPPNRVKPGGCDPHIVRLSDVTAVDYGSPVDRVKVSAVNDYEIVVRGLAAMLSSFAEIDVCDAIIIGETPPIPVDVALYDTFGRVDPHGALLSQLCGQHGVGRVAIYTSPVTPEVVTHARRAGATGVLSKSLPGHELVHDLIRVARGEVVVNAGTTFTAPMSNEAMRDWPGRSRGLTERESSVAALLVEGLSNREIGEALYLSVNTVKTHVRRVLEKLDAPNRTKAAAVLLSDPSFRRASSI